MKIRCSVCGKKVSVRPDVFKKRLERYGVKTKEELEKVYICRECRKKMRKKEKNKKINDSTQIAA